MSLRPSLIHFPTVAAAGLAFVGLASMTLTSANAQDATWAGNGTLFGNFDDPLNWTLAVVPTGTARFQASPTVAISFTGSVGTLQFTAGAPEYSFSPKFPFTGIQLNGAGVINNSSHAPIFSMDQGQLEF
ncbi:MAG TPA: hypothetical protein VEU95_07970, partial [Micropepsaceae bacterium]|nr:hypothetical protein [Micropepsaceae bacterium]